jgi:hypothetical protein
MDRHTDRQTSTRADEWDHVGRTRWHDTSGSAHRRTEDGEPPSRPLLDRLTQAGSGLWVPMPGTRSRNG